MDNKIIAIIIAVIVIAVAGGYFLLNGSSETVTIGYLPSDHDAALFVADAQGKFAENGINTKLVQFNNGGDLMTAMASGEVDVGYVGITPVLSSIGISWTSAWNISHLSSSIAFWFLLVDSATETSE